MHLLQKIESLFNVGRNFDDNIEALITLSTGIGIVFLTRYAIRFACHSIKSFRLYVLCQLCGREDLVAKYGKWALVTGATDGIGLAMVKELARRGHSIIVVGRNEEKLRNTRLCLEQEPNVGELKTVKIDLSDSSQANYERARQEIDPDNRDIGILINNAGIFDSQVSRYDHQNMEIVKDMINVNVIAGLYFTKMVLPGMKRREKGLIINVSSIIGQLTAPYLNVYSPSKTFISRFTKSLQIEYAPYSIKIIDLAPGPVNTKLFDDIKNIPLTSSANSYVRSVLNAVPACRDTMTGCWSHELMLQFGLFVESLGLIPFFIRLFVKLGFTADRMSPVARRKGQTKRD